MSLTSTIASGMRPLPNSDREYIYHVAGKDTGIHLAPL